MSEVDINTGTIFKKTRQAFDNGIKVLINMGGTGSGKTYDTMLFLFSVALSQSNKIITITSESYPHLDVGAIRILDSVCTPLGLWGRDNWNKTKSVWTSPTGTIIEFLSADRVGKALGARRDWLYGNEINNLKVDVWDEMARRSENITADFNPTAQFWLENWMKAYDNTLIIKSNYLDNPFLPDTEKQRIEKRASLDSNFRRIHIDCEYGIFEGLIFENFELIDKMPDGNYTYGLDWGFTNDPSALIKTLETDDAIYLDEMFYRTGMLNKDIISEMGHLGLKKNYDVIVADSAEPKSIEEIHQAGFNILSAVKGADSVRNGIDYMKSKKIYITKRSLNLIKEFRNYSWELDKNKQPTNKPIDAFNHGIDACRYALKPRHRFKFHIK